MISSLCVFCGASDGVAEQYKEVAARFGRLCAEAGIRLVYGGGRVGLMGICADAALAAGGAVVGVIPRILHAREVAHMGVRELHLVHDMHERKQRMSDLCDGFVVLPGGLGTLDEMIEVVTWRQLGLHQKPLAIVDEGGYWRPLLSLFEHVVAEGFAKADIKRFYNVVTNVEQAIPALEAAVVR